MIIDFVRYIRGYVHFKLENGIKERFINLCTSNCVQIWKIKNIPGGIIARCKKKRPKYDL
ncbi:MAG: sporulation protein YqfD [Oscillospiraceae bacterium]